jgi:hypothetical protein
LSFIDALYKKVPALHALSLPSETRIRWVYGFLIEWWRKLGCAEMYPVLSMEKRCIFGVKRTGIISSFILITFKIYSLDDYATLTIA